MQDSIHPQARLWQRTWRYVKDILRRAKYAYVDSINKRVSLSAQVKRIKAAKYILNLTGGGAMHNMGKIYLCKSSFHAYHARSHTSLSMWAQMMA